MPSKSTPNRKPDAVKYLSDGTKVNIYFTGKKGKARGKANGRGKKPDAKAQGKDGRTR